MSDRKTLALADMTPKQREACQWMQGRDESGDLLIIACVRWEHCDVIYRDGVTTTAMHDQITPLPDLPRLEWPASEPADDTPGPAAPRPEDVPMGEVWQVEVDGEVGIGYRNDPDDMMQPWQVIFSREGGIRARLWSADDDVTLIARLVPETAEQDDAPEFDPAHIARDREGDEWEYLDGRWITGETHAIRVAHRHMGLGHDGLPADYGLYTRVDKEADR